MFSSFIRSKTVGAFTHLVFVFLEETKKKDIRLENHLI